MKETGREAQQPTQPGQEQSMKIQPQFIRDEYKGSEKLLGKVALITGGDSGIGRAVALHLAREGAKGLAIVYKDEHDDAKKTAQLVMKEGCQSCLCIPGDIGDAQFCHNTVERVIKELGSLDVLVNNAAEQHARSEVTEISPEQLQRTFATNIFSMFYLTQAAVPHMKPGSRIINTTSVTAYKGKALRLDYSSSKGAIMAYTRSLSQQLVSKGIRVNAVAPGPIWTPLIPATFGEDSAGSFGQEVPMKRAGQPSEVAPAYVFLASDVTGSYFTGQVMHPNGGTIVNS